MSLRVLFRDFNDSRGTYKCAVYETVVAQASVKYNGLWVIHTNGNLERVSAYVEGDTSLDDGWQYGGELYSDVTFTSVER